jgi:hypothetical protein
MRRFVLTLMTLVVMTACGPRWFYPQLDWLLPWYVSDYISLDAHQHNELEIRLTRHLNWHCRTQLPEYALFLRSVRADFENPANPVTHGQFERYLATLIQYWKTLMAGIGPDAADILKTASDKQIDELFDNLEEANQELESTYVDPAAEEILQQRSERMVDRLARSLGDLTTTQQAAVRQWSSDVGASNADWIANRRHVQQAFRALLAERRIDPAFKTRFTAMLTAPERQRTEAYQAEVDRRTTLALNLLTGIAATMTDAQRRHFVDHLGSLAADFDKLACTVAEKPSP